MKAKEAVLKLGNTSFSINVPIQADLLSMGTVDLPPNPREAIDGALAHPLSTPPLKSLVRQKLQTSPRAKAVVVISDNTRPVPYRGEADILSPLLIQLKEAGLSTSQIRLLVATGTHRKMTERELEDKLSPGILAQGFKILQHDCRNPDHLVPLGKTEIGGEIQINRVYMESEIRILTGLVESHFMAGVSGGRKSICPGLLGEKSTHILHGGPILSSPQARDLILQGNPVHEEATRVARMAGCDFVVNVTLDSNYRLTGVFAGDLEEVLKQAYEKIKSYAAIPFSGKYDVILTHGGYVGVNHYQAAKGATLCASLIEENGMCVLAAKHTEPDPIGGPNYKGMLRLLGEIGAKNFCQKILDPSWVFVPEQWEAQMWTRLFTKTSPENLLYCSFEIPEKDFSWLPERDARTIFPGTQSLQELTEKTLDWAVAEKKRQLGKKPRIAVLLDGPYGIPILQ